MNITSEDLQINGKIVSVSTEGVVADASQVHDEGMLRWVNTGMQNDINQYFKNKVEVLTQSITNLNSNVQSIEETEGIPTSTLSQILVLK